MPAITRLQPTGTAGRRQPIDPSIFGRDAANFPERTADIIFNDPADDSIRVGFQVVTQLAQVNDVGVALIVQMVKQSDGNPLNINGASSLEIIIGQPDGTRFTKTAVLYTNGLDGKLYYVTVADDMPVSGIYSVQGKVTVGSATLYGSVTQFSVQRNIEADGPGPEPAPHIGTFDQSDLVNGMFSFDHFKGLDAPFTIDVTIFDNAGHQITPDAVIGFENSVTIDLSSFAPLTGTWGYVYT